MILSDRFLLAYLTEPLIISQGSIFEVCILINFVYIAILSYNIIIENVTSLGDFANFSEVRWRGMENAEIVLIQKLC